MSGFGIGRFGGYSTPSRIYQAVVPANSEMQLYESPRGQFRVTRLSQTDVFDAIRFDPVDEGHLNGLNDKSLRVLAPFAQSVGMMSYGNKQMGSCSLIAPNLAIIACHCIEGRDVRNLDAKFGFVFDGEMQVTHLGTEFKVLQVLEHDPSLDYAIVELEGTPGLQYGHLRIDPSEEINGEPALLHHPLGKSLKLSIHKVVTSQFEATFTSTYHDSDYGSSGGAYLSPSGNFVALHLGSVRDQFDMNLERLALPIQKILQKQPNSLLAYCAMHRLTNAVIESIAQPTYFVPDFLRDLHFIDHEKFDRSKLRDADYLLRPATNELPAVVIDSHQMKHSPSWPGDYHGKKGTQFNQDMIGLDEAVELAEKIVEAMPLFKTRPKVNTILNMTHWLLDKKALGNELYKKLKGHNEIVLVDPAFKVETDTWNIHFYPK